MNKNILAIAVATAMVAGSAAVMADATVYGKIHMSVDSMDNGTSGGDATDSSIYVSSNSSRLGVKGDADLDGGLKVIYKYEMSTDYSNVDSVKDAGTAKAKPSGGILGNRNAYLGLKGGFGTVLVGRHDTPLKTVGRKNDLFGDTIADARNLTNDNGHDARASDVLVYANKFGAVDLVVAYVPEDGTEDGGAFGASLGFAQGPLKLAAATQTFNGATDDPSAMNITASYDMGAATINALYQSETDGGDGDTMGLGAKFKSGMNTFKAQYVTRSNDVASGAAKDDGTMLALGVDHKMGKNTSVYAVYASMSNDDGADFGLGGSGHDGDKPAGEMAEDYTGISVGMIHKF